jgi:hypothetical protein
LGLRVGSAAGKARGPHDAATSKRTHIARVNLFVCMANLPLCIVFHTLDHWWMIGHHPKRMIVG